MSNRDEANSEAALAQLSNMVLILRTQPDVAKTATKKEWADTMRRLIDIYEGPET
jgi:hypothetical protein